MVVGGRIRSGVERGKQFEFDFDGRPVVAYEGETVAAALLASGVRTFRHTARHGTPRGIFCGMGICFDCLATVDGVPNVRTCVTPAVPGMKVQTQWESLGNGGR
jgi:predicted molibdopterin-dependent oxidoreductase YjgC